MRNLLATAMLAGLLVSLIIAGTGITSVRAELGDHTYIHPGGRYTLQWSDPWAVLRQEGEWTILGDGDVVAGVTGVTDSGTINPQICLDRWVLADLGGPINPESVVIETVTTWRAYIAYINLEAGFTDYFECQMLPDQSGMVQILGSAQILGQQAALQKIIDFTGELVVRPYGEPAPVLASGGWRVAVSAWTRGSVYADLGLTQKDGKEWVVLVADVTSWEAPSDQFNLRDLTISPVTGDLHVHRASVPYSAAAAQALGEEPAVEAETLTIPAGTTTRVALVFGAHSEDGDLVLALGDQPMTLEKAPGPVRFVVLAPPSRMPLLETATVTEVAGPGLLAVRMDQTGASEMIAIAGIAVPQQGECYTDESMAQLEALVGASVTLESDLALPDGSVVPRHAWITGEAGVPLHLGVLLVSEGFARADEAASSHRFAAMIDAAEISAEAALAGLWSTCGEAATTSSGSEEVTAGAPTPELTAADKAYLTRLQEDRDFVVVTMEKYDEVMADGLVGSDEEWNTLALIMASWALAADNVNGLAPTEPFNSLQQEWIDALTPYDELAHQIAPELDAWFAGEVDLIDMPGYDPAQMAAADAAARPALDAVMAKIDEALRQAGLI